jgi:DNA polymerase elongation subunit (family B)
MSYRNCVYNNSKKNITLFTWDAKGNRVTQEIDYKPYLFLEDKNGPDRSIYGTSIRKKEFKDNWERNKFVKESGIKKIFENLPPYQQFLIDNYSHNCGDDDFADQPLKVMVIDIENPLEFGYPNIELADSVINLITCYDSLTKRYTMFGLKLYKPKNTDTDYHHCKSEHDLLKRFIGHFSSDYPDLVSGWNSNGYDLRYLINRITFELGKDWADELSPIGRIYEKVNKQGKFGQPSIEYVIEGISCLDYMILYQKFKLDD